MSLGTGMDGTEYRGFEGWDSRTQSEKDSQELVSFVGAIVNGNMREFNRILTKNPENVVDARVPVASAYVRPDSRGVLVISARCAGGDSAHFAFLVGKLFERIAAEKDKQGKPYEPATCDEYNRTYMLSPLMLAYLYGRVGMAKKLIDVGASAEDTETIYHMVKGRPTPEVWTTQRFAFPPDDSESESAPVGGTRRRHGPKKTRRRRSVRRTPRKK